VAPVPPPRSAPPGSSGTSLISPSSLSSVMSDTEGTRSMSWRS
jgi:hypothetical protein